jgi:alpha-galactosidase
MSIISRTLFLLAASSVAATTITYADLPPAPASGASPAAPPLPEAAPVVLTPPSPPTPQIHGAKVYGVHPGFPCLFMVAATGDRPMTFSADNLPTGLALDSATGLITGNVEKAGNYPITLHAKNALGETQRTLVIKVGSFIALTPPMGWNSWNAFGPGISDAKVRVEADIMVKSGLINHGWTYINIDDYWQVNPTAKDPTLHGPERDAKGNILSNPRFPDMKALADYIHAKGLRAGLYSSPGPYTCGGCTGSYQHENEDAAQYAAWGYDYLKYDWCSYNQFYKAEDGLEGEKKPYRIMAEALGKVNRDIVFSFCQYGGAKVWEWGAATGGNLWRITGDIKYNWASLLKNGEKGNGIDSYNGPGHWNDPDLLAIGHMHSPNHLTPDEQYTNVSLWCLQSAPLLFSFRLTELDPFTFGLLSNDEVIDVDQDPLGKGAHVINPATADSTHIQIWAKPLEDGSVAVGVFNLGDTAASGTLNWSDLQIQGRRVVRDLWRQKDLGTFDQKFDTSSIPSHGVILLRLTSIAAP